MSYWENNGKSDEWYTPPEIFQALDCEFDLDVAAPEFRTHCCVPAKHFITHDSLRQEWKGFIWMNPPFGGRNGIVPWNDKFFLRDNGIALTPDRTSAPWWQQASKQCSALLFINGKVKFIRPDGSRGESPSNGTTLFAAGPYAAQILMKAEKNKLGKCFLNP